MKYSAIVIRWLFRANLQCQCLTESKLVSPLTVGSRKKQHHFEMFKVNQIHYGKNVPLCENLPRKSTATDYRKNMDRKLLQCHKEYLRTKVLQYVWQYWTKHCNNSRTAILTTLTFTMIEGHNFISTKAEESMRGKCHLFTLMINPRYTSLPKTFASQSLCW